MTNQPNAGRPARKRASAPSATPKKAHYISFNDQELDCLRQLGFRERWAYMELKKLSNWKDGTCGEFDKQRITYAQIATLVTAPGVQGRGQGGIDDKQAAEFLERMQAVGLVANIGRRANGGLRFDMPLSPIQRDKAGQSGEITMPTPGDLPKISPDQITPQMPAKAAPALVCDQLSHSLSVMINNKENISIDEAGSAVADTAPCRVSDAAPARENPSAQPLAAPLLSAQEIHSAVAASWMITETNSAEAHLLYKTWADVGVTLDELYAAMNSVEEGPLCLAQPTPADITPVLWPMLLERWSD